MTQTKLKKIKTGFALLALFAMLAIGNFARASEITGTLTTGLSGTVINPQPEIVIAPPTANPPAGVYSSSQQISLIGSEGTLSIHYTTDGTMPSCSTGAAYYSPIPVDSTISIEALSCYQNSLASSVAVFLYSISTSSPEIVSPAVISSGGGRSSGGGGGTIFNIADLNKDGKVDIKDFVILMMNWNQVGANVTGDFNHDGKVDILDIVILMANWTK